MNSAVNFLLESGVSLALLSLIYILFLRRDTFFRLNRIFLLISIVFSVILPFLKFQIYEPHPTMLAEVTVTPYRNLIEAVTIYGRDLSGTVVQTISSSRIIIMVYLLGLIFFAGRLIFRLVQIVLLVRKNKVTQVELVKFVAIEKDFSPFSFLRYVFINPDKKNEPGYEKMVAHELEHIKQGHTFDVLILEILTVLQWFNPFMWILKRVIRENHEFLADQAVLSSGISPAQYKHLLLNQAVGIQVDMANNFNSSLVKKRIKMISKIHSSKYGKLKILLGLVVIFGLLTAFAFEEKKSSVKNKDKALILNLDEPISRNAEELQYISGIIENANNNEQALDRLKNEYKVDYRYGVYGVSWKRNYADGVFFIDGNEASFAEVQKLEKDGKRNALATLSNDTQDFKPFLDKYGEKAKNGVYFVYSDIKYKDIHPQSFPVKATDVEATIPKVLDKFYKNTNENKIDKTPIVVNVNGKQMIIKTNDFTLEDVKQLFRCNDKYEIEVLAENNTINLKSKAKLVAATLDGDPVFFIVEEMPKFPGGDSELRKYVANNIKYPAEAQQNNIEGKVYVTFVVSKDGSVKNAEIARGVAPSLDNEALRVIKSLPKWTPGKQRGQAVNVSYTVPINFALNDKEKAKNDLRVDEKNAKINKDGVFFIVEEMPEFPGGIDAMKTFIAEHVKYPVDAKNAGIQGKVYVSFTVGSDGWVKDAVIARGVHPSLDKEAIRVIESLPAFKPGKQRGKPVDVGYTTPINFVLESGAATQNNSVMKTNSKDGKLDVETEQVFFIVEEMPEFPGGDEALRKYIANKVKYPEIAHKNGIAGKVYVTFVVGKDGKVFNTRIARGVDPILDKEALRVINSLPKWKPGYQRGKAVNVAYTVPINFSLK